MSLPITHKETLRQTTFSLPASPSLQGKQHQLCLAERSEFLGCKKLQKYRQLLLQTHAHKRGFQLGEHSDLVSLLNKLAHMITSVMSWDPQKTCCNYQSSEEVLVQESAHKCPRSRFTNTDKMWPVKKSDIKSKSEFS